MVINKKLLYLKYVQTIINHRNDYNFNCL